VPVLLIYAIMFTWNFGMTRAPCERIEIARKYYHVHHDAMNASSRAGMTEY